MRVCIIGLHLFVLGLSYQADRESREIHDVSTLMYYVVLTMERSALPNITKALDSFAPEGLSVQLSDLAATTHCQPTENGYLCLCRHEYLWSRQVCERQPSCCNPSVQCSLHVGVDPVCHPKTRVTINGSIYLNNETYDHNLANPESAKFKRLSADLIKKMRRVYSTLRGFDGINITEFRLGVYAYFEVHVNNKMSTEELEQKTEEAVNILNARLAVDTIGLVDITIPVQPVGLSSSVQIVCTLPQKEPSEQEWSQSTPKDVFPITNGTESVVTSDGAQNTTLTLTNMSAIWTGLITCTFRPVKNTSVKILHRARVTLDVALLPQIEIISEPQFPKCNAGSTVVAVNVKCEIQNSSEAYSTAWNFPQNQSEIVTENNFELKLISYGVRSAVGCLPQDEAQPANVTCVFTNRKNQTRSASIQINVIYKSSKFCQEGKGWPNTKAGFIARLRCEGQAGWRQRKCNDQGEWEEVEPWCVNHDLSSIIQETLIINKGLGSVSINSEKLFSRLASATDHQENITVSNLNASINILDNMQRLNTIFNESTIDNIVKSSSNILNISLGDDWMKPTRNAESNMSMAELYLASVEKLISQTNISGTLTRNSPNIQLQTCDSPGCKSRVFNVNVSVNGNSGLVKTAGFRNLLNFLPIQPDADPNSIVVTMSFDGKQLRKPQVWIQFELFSPRLRNHVLRCIAMDAVGDQWQQDRCTWGGTSDEESCYCESSSTFASFLSKYPVDLPALQEIYYVGLTCSIISLLTFLVIEGLVWSAVVKTNSLYLRHVTLVNISVSVLVGDCSTLASTVKVVSDDWCQACTILKHFFYLAQFCWMFCLSTLLLYQTMFVFSDLSKGRNQGVCYFTGYGAPFMIVTTAFLTHDGGAEGKYYDRKYCWLTHDGLFKGSFYSFIIPVGIIVFFNIFSMALVIMKLLNHPRGGGRSGRHVALRILRSIIILTPVFGITWFFGLATMVLDLAGGMAAHVVYYIFIISSSFQGLFILLTTCVAEKMVRDALRKRLSAADPHSSTKDTSLTLQSVIDK